MGDCVMLPCPHLPIPLQPLLLTPLSSLLTFPYRNFLKSIVLLTILELVPDGLSNDALNQGDTSGATTYSS